MPQPNPNKEQNQDLNDKTVVVQVAQNGKLKINNEDTTWDGLGPRIEQIFKDRAEKVAFVKGDNDVLFMDVAQGHRHHARLGNRQSGTDYREARSGSVSQVENAPRRADVNPSVDRFGPRLTGMDDSMTYASSVRIARRGFSAAALVVLVAAGSGCSKLKARDLLNKGVANFKNGQYDKAVEDFKEAKDLDPSLMNARLYLATAYASQYIPGAPSDENVTRGNAAIDEFKGVLEKDPNNLSAIDGIGSILFQMSGQPFNPQKFQESKTYHQKHIELKPTDPEPYYWIGVIDWTLAFRANAELRTAYNKDHINKQIKEGDALPAAVRTDYVAKDGPWSTKVLRICKRLSNQARLRRCHGVPEFAVSPEGRHGGERR